MHEVSSLNSPMRLNEEAENRKEEVVVEQRRNRRKLVYGRSMTLPLDLLADSMCLKKRLAPSLQSSRDLQHPSEIRPMSSLKHLPLEKQEVEMGPPSPSQLEWSPASHCS